MYFILIVGCFFITFSDVVVNIDMTTKVHILSNEITANDTYMIESNNIDDILS